MPDFIPSREADLVTWSNNFNTLINADPATYGLTSAQTMVFTGLHDDFVSSYQTASDPSTRTPSSIVTKNTAKDALIENARDLAGIVQNFPGTTDTERSDLGLTVPDTDPTPVGLPKSAPGIEIVSAVGRTVKLRLWDTLNPESRGKPVGVDGATVLSYIGPTPPAPTDIDAWKFEGNISRTTTSITFPPTVATGATAWFTAFWFNPRKQSGPATLPVSTQIPGSLPAAA